MAAQSGEVMRPRKLGDVLRLSLLRLKGLTLVRTRLLLTRIEDWRAVAAVHGEFFRDIRPVNTIMQVSRFIDPEWLVEIEADAVVDAAGDAL
jgi:enamine deaminase RidA (YjgF/YER057c/UK114 family)